MRNVLKDYSEVAHYWANAVQESGRAREHRMYFEGEYIYSYGSHFCMARRLSPGVFVMTTRGYSPTTSKHLFEVRRAIHGKTVYCHNPRGFATDNREKAVNEIEEEILASQRPRIRQVTRDRHMAEAARLIKQFNDYLEVLPEKERICPPIPELQGTSKEQAERIKQVREEEERRRAEARRKAEEERNRRAEEALQEWLAGSDRRPYHYGPARLRIKDDMIETSHGAEVPVSHAKRLWPMIVDSHEKQSTYCPGHQIRVGVYTLFKIEKGDLRIGCHEIEYSELLRIAGLLGLVEEVAA